LQSNIAKSGAFKESQALPVFLDICFALSYIHRLDIAHRDIKCENVLLTTVSRGIDMRAKLADFGLSRIAGASVDCRTYCGTALNMAPEVIRCRLSSVSNRCVDKGTAPIGYGLQADMYSLGILLYIMLCGSHPDALCREPCYNVLLGVDGPNDDADWHALPSLAKELISNLLAESPRDRPTADEVIDHAWLSRGSPAAKQSRDLDRSVERSGKRLRVSGIAGCVSHPT